MDKMDPCCQPHIFEPTVLARDNRFTIRVRPSVVKGLKNVMTTMIEDRMNEHWKYTMSLQQARAAVVVTGTSEHVFSTELVTELMAGITETQVREMVSRQRASR